MNLRAILSTVISAFSNLVFFSYINIREVFTKCFKASIISLKSLDQVTRSISSKMNFWDLLASGRPSIGSSVKFTFLKRHLSNRISREHVYMHILRNQTIWFNTSHVKILQNHPAMDFLYRRSIFKGQLKYNSNCCLLTC